MNKNPLNAEGPANSDEMPGFSDSKVIMRRLRKYYVAVQQAEVPDRLLELVDKLDSAEKKSKGPGKS